MSTVDVRGHYEDKMRTYTDTDTEENVDSNSVYFKKTPETKAFKTRAL